MRLLAQDLTVGYGGMAACRRVSMDVSRGELLCLLGPNGSGKTALFRTLLGFMPALAGHINIDGKPLDAYSRKELARKLAFVPQAFNTYFPHLVLDTVLMGRAPHIGLFATPAQNDRDRAIDCLESLGIAHLAGRPLSAISGGQRQLVLIARAMAQDAALIILDEPTSSLDFGNQMRVLNVLKGIVAGGAGVVFSTHDPNHALIGVDKVVLLNDGAMMCSGPPLDVINSANLTILYGIETVVGAIPPTGQIACVPANNQMMH